MTPDRVREVAAKYRDLLIKEGVTPSRISEVESTAPHYVVAKEKMGHLLWVCVTLKEVVEKGKIEQARRWLRFVQGALWGMELISIQDLREDDV